MEVQVMMLRLSSLSYKTIYRYLGRKGQTESCTVHLKNETEFFNRNPMKRLLILMVLAGMVSGMSAQPWKPRIEKITGIP
jgi:hypothetical protein